jgi:TetR/AcrR family transcriptional regulator, lmrAB and yxaGH operons repressor
LSAAGLNEVVALAKAPKGSLYHYFPTGKQQMVAESLLMYRDTIDAGLRQALHATAPLPERIHTLFERTAQRMQQAGWRESCAVAAVVLDLRAANAAGGVDAAPATGADPDAALRQLCEAVLAQWAQTAAEGLPELPERQQGPKRPQRPTHPRAAGGWMLVNLLEGAQISARAQRHARPLEEAAEAFVVWAECMYST